MDESFALHAARIPPLTAEDAQRYIDSFGELTCTCCQSKNSLSVVQKSFHASQEFQNHSDGKYSAIVPLPVHYALAESFFQLPFMYSMPAVCDNCGHIQLFSLGNVLNYVNGDANNEKE